MYCYLRFLYIAMTETSAAASDTKVGIMAVLCLLAL